MTSDITKDYPDLVCLSHLRWNGVFQRPQHLMLRAARRGRVFFFEEPVTQDIGTPRLDVQLVAPNVYRLTPLMPANQPADHHASAMRLMLDDALERFELRRFVLWYYTPMALPFTRHLNPVSIVYDCMDELSAFAGAPAELPSLERELMQRAAVVFTGGHALYESKRFFHDNVHAMPSSVDIAHFARARDWKDEPEDQRLLPRPRLGFAGVIDERMDLELVRSVARRRRDWQLIFVGPVIKIDPALLPHEPNITWLGPRSYDELPAYMSGWDVALIPFARNKSTRFISPTKTPEYLAAGCPVVSTPIRDVERTYGSIGLARIANGAPAFVTAIGQALTDRTPTWFDRVDNRLRSESWDATWRQMETLMHAPFSGRFPEEVYV